MKGFVYYPFCYDVKEMRSKFDSYFQKRAKRKVSSDKIKE
jgi:hypothetical protein